jgi:deoxyadenosine/deoxycytidine kinase
MTANPTKNKPLFFIVEGCIGSGKSTLIEQLKQVMEKNHNLKVCVIPEPVDVWVDSGALQTFYSDIKNNAYSFQTFVYATRVMRIKEYVTKFSDADVFLIERSVISDRHLFAKVLQESECFTPVQVTMYDYWVTMWNHLLPFRAPHGFIYLAPSLEETLRRIQSRARAGESVSREYQLTLQTKHEEIFGQLHTPSDKSKVFDISTTMICNNIPTPVLRIYCDDDYRDNHTHEVFQKIIQFICSFSH